MGIFDRFQDKLASFLDLIKRPALECNDIERDELPECVQERQRYFIRKRVGNF